MDMLVKKVELRFDSKELSESEIETRMTRIEEMFSESSEQHEFRTVLKSYAGENTEDHNNRIGFEFRERQGISLIDVIKMLESWKDEKVINIEYSIYLRNLKANLI